MLLSTFPLLPVEGSVGGNPACKALQYPFYHAGRGRGEKAPCTRSHTNSFSHGLQLAPTIICIVPIGVLRGGRHDTGGFIWAGMLVAVVIVIRCPICRAGKAEDSLVIRPEEVSLWLRGTPLPRELNILKEELHIFSALPSDEGRQEGRAWGCYGPATQCWYWAWQNA